MSIYNLHRSPDNWGPNSQAFEPMRFGPLELGQPNELNGGYRYTPFSGDRAGAPDKFAVLEGMAIWAVLFRRVDMELVQGHDEVTLEAATIEPATDAGQREERGSWWRLWRRATRWTGPISSRRRTLARGGSRRASRGKSGGKKCPMPFVK